MSIDLESQLDEMGPAYRAVVDRLRGAKTVEPMRGGAVGMFTGRAAAYLVAASLLSVVGLSAVLVPTRPQSPNVAAAAREYTLAEMQDDAAVKEMIRTQNPDGSWKNDFLTRRNAAALRNCRDNDARIAYKKAMRNLRTRGLF